MAKILVLDNYDSFTYNLVYIVRDLGYGGSLDIFRNDAISLEKINTYDKIILSPGPGIPQEAGIMPELLQAFSPQKSILGVCLGHQAIGEAFGATLKNLDSVLHGIALETQVLDGEELLFQQIPSKFLAGRYHSWAIDPQQLGTELIVTASDAQNEVMAVRHKRFDVRGVQFHPESILTQYGVEMIANWLKR